VVRTLSSKKILTDLGCDSDEMWKEFWKILLCRDNRGIGLLALDEPIRIWGSNAQLGNFAVTVISKPTLSTDRHLSGLPRVPDSITRAGRISFALIAPRVTAASVKEEMHLAIARGA